MRPGLFAFQRRAAYMRPLHSLRQGGIPLPSFRRMPESRADERTRGSGNPATRTESPHSRFSSIPVRLDSVEPFLSGRLRHRNDGKISIFGLFQQPLKGVFIPPPRSGPGPHFPAIAVTGSFAGRARIARVRSEHSRRRGGEENEAGEFPAMASCGSRRREEALRGWIRERRGNESNDIFDKIRYIHGVFR